MYMIVLLFTVLAINNIVLITLLSSLVYELLYQLQSFKLCMELKLYIVIQKSYGRETMDKKLNLC